MNPIPLPSIVLVDDEKPYIELMAHMLEENLGCRVATFVRPLDALRALPGLRPAVLVSDYFMPQMNGLDFLRQAAPLTPDASFLIITGHNIAAVEGQLSGIPRLLGVLAKPFGWRQLGEEILRVWPADRPRPEGVRTTVPSP